MKSGSGFGLGWAGVLAVAIVSFGRCVLAQDFSGLWVGTAEVLRVNEPQSAPVVPVPGSLSRSGTEPLTPSEPAMTNSTYLQLVRTNFPVEPTSVAQPARLRVLLHVDRGGKATLLHQVALVRRTQGDRLALITEAGRAALYRGVVDRGDKRVPRIFSTAHFDFGRAALLPMQGIVRTNLDWLSATNRIPYDAPTNPFLHRYHPDHDNRAADFTGARKEALDVQREFRIRFGPVAGALGSLETTEDSLRGEYEETVRGLAHFPVKAAGSLELRRVVRVEQLNEEP